MWIRRCSFYDNFTRVIHQEIQHSLHIQTYICQYTADMANWALLLTLWGSFSLSLACPVKCRCLTESLFHVTNCSDSGLDAVPENLDEYTNYLDLTGNNIKQIKGAEISHIYALTTLDTRNNPYLEWIDIFPTLVCLDTIFTDLGTTCCMYYMRWEHRYSNDSSVNCQSTIKSKECDDVLLKIFTLLLYGVLIPMSLVINPWVITVTLCTEKRRRDPYTLNLMNYSIANLLTSIYATVMLIMGIKLHGNYAPKMDAWLNNPVCGAIGFMLITSTFLKTFFHTLTVIIIYQKLKYSLNIERHLSLSHFIIGTGTCWTLSLLFASLPFMTEKRYNRVGSCLPFYEKRYGSFAYVIFYTAVVGTCNVANATLAGMLLRSLRGGNKINATPGQCDRQILNENNTIRRTIIGHTVYNTVFNLIIVAFLVMSCIGGQIGKLGREWFTRLLVIQTLLGPIVGPLRKKGFYRDTLRLFQRWNCYDWDKSRIAIGANSTRRSTATTARHNQEISVVDSASN